ncbi:endonuclease [Lactobacillus plantarum]|uniref:Endonuclease n=1 Tax=Lactiplantibacillus plantarum TaxID=1590 RepID=A0A0S2MMD1_LACPN|nr:GIY-YIG nuclease family protein [Lactiplantibacillus plantarum]ALO75851.1 endonuclease [Lactiplantibacillus plantarum]MCG0634974.1 GIY-YIG nuclease family protein [Lactiplantibacillus plantarum]MZV33609.1 endonuclease [Lactiplantibacillus plantarum]MZV53927.1 endonuclease [Lactiplantibacillus plantarum]MZV61760.1 endonuclease [Lactiplantibacillus plantarum]
MKDIFLNDLLKFSDFDNVKIKFNKSNGQDDPIDLFKENPDLVNNQWLFWRSKRRNFNVNDIAINLIRVRDDLYLLTTIKKVTKELDRTNQINYEGEELEDYQSLFGRVIIKFHKKFETAVVKADKIINQMVVFQILPVIFDDNGFPGYDNVCVSYQQLNFVLEQHKSDWINALSHQKAVYLIRDMSNGKLYVGSATAKNGMLLSRWSSYIKNGHGGNKNLKDLVNQYGFDYVKNNFQYSILENYNSIVDDKFVLSRESWWKKVFDSRNPQFGYNAN